MNYKILKYFQRIFIKLKKKITTSKSMHNLDQHKTWGEFNGRWYAGTIDKCFITLKSKWYEEFQRAVGMKLVFGVNHQIEKCILEPLNWKK